MNFLYPLTEFYEAAGLPSPPFQKVGPEDIPEPNRRLLVHKHYMTDTLEVAFGQKLELRVISHCLQKQVLSRHVLLVTQDASPVEMGAIRIYLHGFPDKA